MKARLYHNKNILTIWRPGLESTRTSIRTHRAGTRANPPRPYRSRSRFRAISRKSSEWTAYRKSRSGPDLCNDSDLCPSCYRVSFRRFSFMNLPFVFIGFTIVCIPRLFRFQNIETLVFHLMTHDFRVVDMRSFVRCLRKEGK